MSVKSLNQLEAIIQGLYQGTIDELAWRRALAGVALQIKLNHSRRSLASNDKAFLKSLIGHFRRALEIKQRLRSNELREIAAKQALEHASFGIVVLDYAGEVLEISKPAIAALKSAGALQRRVGGEYFFVKAVDRALQHRITLPPNEQEFGDVIQVPRQPHRLPIYLVFASIVSVESPWLTEPPRCILFVFDPERAEETSIVLLANELGITRREAEIVVLLTTGHSLRRTASLLKITLETARDHLKSIFRKTSVHSQAALVRRVLSGPASHNVQ